MRYVMVNNVGMLDHALVVEGNPETLRVFDSPYHAAKWLLEHADPEDDQMAIIPAESIGNRYD